MPTFTIWTKPDTTVFSVKITSTWNAAQAAGIPHKAAAGMFTPHTPSGDELGMGSMFLGTFVLRADDDTVSSSLIAHEAVHGASWIHRYMGTKGWHWFDYKQEGYKRGEQREEALARQVQAIHGQITQGIKTYLPRIKIRYGF